MNHQIPESVLLKATQNESMARFLHYTTTTSSSNSSNEKGHNNKRRRRPKSSKLIKQLGGMAMLDFLAAASSDRLAKDPNLQSVYGELRRRKLVALEKKLLLFAFADEDDEEQEDDGNRDPAVLVRQCELGLMFRRNLFKSFFLAHLEVFYRHVKDETIMLQCAKRLAALRPLLDVTWLEMRLSFEKQNNQFNPTLCSIPENLEKVVDIERRTKKRTMDFRQFPAKILRMHLWNAKAA
eukprot:scaffold6397_cov103-Cylindrotheca_fusiformis.AAC.3